MGLIPNVVFEGHLAAALLGLLAFIAVQAIADISHNTAATLFPLLQNENEFCVWQFAKMFLRYPSSYF